MTTDSEAIQTTIAAAQALALTPAQLVAMCDFCIASLLSSGKPTIGYTIGGKEFTFSLKQAQDLRAMYKDLARDDAGPMDSNLAEFC